MKVGLALGGGVARGLAHIGVLSVLERYRVPVDCVAGTSAGAIVGALFASGVPLSRIFEEAAKTRWRDLVRLAMHKEGLIKPAGLEKHLTELMSASEFTDLKIPFAAVATDVTTGEEVVLDSGNVAKAVLASSAIPGIFTPVRIGDRLLVDGGVVNNVPASVVRRMGADLVIAVDVNHHELARKEPTNIFHIIVNSIHIMQRANAQKELAYADLVIQPNLQGMGLMDLERCREFVGRGAVATASMIPKILERLGRL